MSLFCCFVLWSSPARLGEIIHQKRRIGRRRRKEDGRWRKKELSGGKKNNGEKRGEFEGREWKGRERRNEGKVKDGKETKVEEGKDIHNTPYMHVMGRYMVSIVT